ncbi:MULTISPECIES: hypothetical protein [unclassified Bradyrhizobium]|uniref:hypothetical protein n=1 Tax=unclassified Bradyrhizobium TaxID=2631580 RepID=UPI00291675F9|nr:MULTISPECIES: hypothetical protein [unclassified Bradyrhizobium]
MNKPVRIIKHEVIAKCGSFEVRFADGRPSRYFYWDDIAGRRLNPDMLTQDQALEKARTLAREEAARNESSGKDSDSP